MLDLRGALKAALGASINVSHAGPSGVVVVPVAVVNAGTEVGEETPLPVIAFVGEFGNAEPTHIGAGAAMNEVFAEIHIRTIEQPGEIDAPSLAVDIHKALEARVRQVEKTLGGSFLTITTHYRDFPPRQTEAGPFWFTRYVSVRGVNLEKY